MGVARRRLKNRNPPFYPGFPPDSQSPGPAQPLPESHRPERPRRFPGAPARYTSTMNSDRYSHSSRDSGQGHDASSPRRPAVTSIATSSDARGDGFNRLLRDLGRFSALDRRLAEHIPAPIRERVGVARVRGDCLVLAARDPVAAARTRLLAPTLLARAAEFWPAPLANWRVVVCPDVEFTRQSD